MLNGTMGKKHINSLWGKMLSSVMSGIITSGFQMGRLSELNFVVSE
jgi:hypothetical protein